ncbi:hypothetical protein BKA65DRAFT_521460 [Rhexocercosporidium sp. MPI-PUGE-AT-0058]|nr:hypothetical protein BKA65DRAFT_521460 [Rhexocercosporidium sp. MPI-PUGE-AT-0058]
MADPLSIAASAIAVVSLAVQTFETMSSLSRFISSLSDAPEEVRRVAAEVSDVEAVLQEFLFMDGSRNSNISHELTDSLLKAIGRTRLVVAELHTALQTDTTKYKPHKAKFQRLRWCLVHKRKLDETSQHIRQLCNLLSYVTLHANNNTRLQLANLQVSGVLIGSPMHAYQIYEYGLPGDPSEDSDLFVDAPETPILTFVAFDGRIEIHQILAKIRTLQRKIDTMSITRADVQSVKLEVQHFYQALLGLDMLLKSVLVDHCESSDFSPALRISGEILDSILGLFGNLEIPTRKKDVERWWSKSFTQLQVRKYLRRFERARCALTVAQLAVISRSGGQSGKFAAGVISNSLQSMAPWMSIEIRTSFEPGELWTLSGEPADIFSTAVSPNVKHTRVLKTLLGCVLYTYDELHAGIHRLGFKVLPSYWLSNRGFHCVFTTTHRSNTRPLSKVVPETVSLSFTLVDIHRADSPLFEACRHFEVDSLKGIFASGKATPYNVLDGDGRGLAAIVMASVFGKIVPHKPTDSTDQVGTEVENLHHKLQQRLNFVKFLIHAGVDFDKTFTPSLQPAGEDSIQSGPSSLLPGWYLRDLMALLDPIPFEIEGKTELSPSRIENDWYLVSWKINETQTIYGESALTWFSQLFRMHQKKPPPGTYQSGATYESYLAMLDSPMLPRTSEQHDPVSANVKDDFEVYDGWQASADDPLGKRKEHLVANLYNRYRLEERRRKLAHTKLVMLLWTIRCTAVGVCTTFGLFVLPARHLTLLTWAIIELWLRRKSIIERSEFEILKERYQLDLESVKLSTANDLLGFTIERRSNMSSHLPVVSTKVWPHNNRRSHTAINTTVADLDSESFDGTHSENGQSASDIFDTNHSRNHNSTAPSSSPNRDVPTAAVDEFVRMLEDHPKIRSHLKTLHRRLNGPEFQEHLHLLLQKFGFMLQSEASIPYEEAAAQLILFQSRRISYVMRSRIFVTEASSLNLMALAEQKSLSHSENVERLFKSFEADLIEPAEIPIEELEIDIAENAELPLLTSIREVEAFLVQSSAFSEFASGLESLLLPQAYWAFTFKSPAKIEITSVVYYLIGQAISCLLPVADVIYYIRVKLRPAVPAGHRRLEWICECGDGLYADFDNRDPKAVERLNEELQTLRKANIVREQPKAADLELKLPPLTKNHRESSANMDVLPTTPLLGAMGSPSNPILKQRPEESTDKVSKQHGSESASTSLVRGDRRQDSTSSTEGSTNRSSATSRSASVGSSSQSSLQFHTDPSTRTNLQLSVNEPIYMEICVKHKQYTSRHKEVQVSASEDDYLFFKRVKDAYIEIRQPRWNIFNIFLKPFQVNHVQFSVQSMGAVVGIFHHDGPKIPPVEDVKNGSYHYDPCPWPGEPVPSSIILHELNSF